MLRGAFHDVGRRSRAARFGLGEAHETDADQGGAGLRGLVSAACVRAAYAVVVAFYLADWSPLCSDQMALYQEIMPELKGHNAQLLGISVDGV